MVADLSGTAAGRDLYVEIDGGYVDKMSFSFSVRESKYDTLTHTRTITKIGKLYDVSAVDIPAYEETSISARSFFGGVLKRGQSFGASCAAEKVAGPHTHLFPK